MRHDSTSFRNTSTAGDACGNIGSFAWSHKPRRLIANETVSGATANKLQNFPACVPIEENKPRKDELNRDDASHGTFKRAGDSTGACEEANAKA